MESTFIETSVCLSSILCFSLLWDSCLLQTALFEKVKSTEKMGLYGIISIYPATLSGGYFLSPHFTGGNMEMYREVICPK